MLEKQRQHQHPPRYNKQAPQEHCKGTIIIPFLDSIFTNNLEEQLNSEQCKLHLHGHWSWTWFQWSGRSWLPSRVVLLLFCNSCFRAVFPFPACYKNTKLLCWKVKWVDHSKWGTCLFRRHCPYSPNIHTPLHTMSMLPVTSCLSKHSISIRKCSRTHPGSTKAPRWA